MNKPNYKKILDHPDRDEIISKLVIGISTEDINDWLKAKYTNINESKFVLSNKNLKLFKDNYLDFYNEMSQDLALTKAALVTTNTSDQLNIVVKGNSAYKEALLKVANNELDIEKIMATMAINVETRMAQVFDEMMEDPRNINTKVDRLFGEYAEILANLLDKYHKWKEKPVADQIIQHNITLQVVDQHIAVFHDVIKKVLTQMDLEASMYFLEVWNEEMSKLKLPNMDPTTSQEMKLAEVSFLNETINTKINQ